MTVSLTRQPACETLERWQRSVAEHKFDPDRGPEMTAAQQRLVRALVRCGTDVSAVVAAMADGDASAERCLLDAVQAAPVLRQKLSPSEIDAPRWSTDVMIHDSLSASGMTRSLASDYRYWHLVTLRQIQAGTVPGGDWLLGRRLEQFPPLPFPEGMLSVSPDGLSPDRVKDLDGLARNVLRRGGGIWLRAHNFRVDCPMALAWWRVELARRTEGACADVTAEEVYSEVLHCKEWFKKTTRSYPRMASPNAVAGLVIACRQQPDASVPALLATLARRAIGFDADRVDPHVLAMLAAED